MVDEPGPSWAAGPLRGEALRDWLDRCIVEEWRGEAEPVHSVPAGTDDVRCVCGIDFTFKPGSTRARCPGCGCRYERPGEVCGEVKAPSPAGLGK